MALLMGVSSWARMVSTTLSVFRLLCLPPNKIVLWGAAVASPAQASRQITFLSTFLSRLSYQDYSSRFQKSSLPLPYCCCKTETVPRLYEDKGWLSVSRRRVSQPYIASSHRAVTGLPATGHCWGGERGDNLYIKYNLTSH